MPDAQGNQKADSETDTSLHAYKDRPEDIKGDPTGSDVAQESKGERNDPDKH